jgi:hypothetical protein
MQQGEGFGAGEQVHLDGGGDPGEPAASGGDHHMSAALGQPRPDQVGLFDVVEHDQPPSPGLQPCQRLGGGHRYYRVRGHPSRRDGQGGELFTDQRRLVGVDPPHEVVVAGVSVRVLDRRAGFAHPAHAVHRLHQRPIPCRQALAQLGQHTIAAGERRIAGGHVPHLWPIVAVGGLVTVRVTRRLVAARCGTWGVVVVVRVPWRRW